MSLAAQLFIGTELALTAATFAAVTGWRRAVDRLKQRDADDEATAPIRQLMYDQNKAVRYFARALVKNLRYYTENTDPNAMISFNAVQGMLGADILNLENALKGVIPNVYYDQNPPADAGNG